MCKRDFRREANSKILNHNRPQPVQEPQENGKALPAFLSLEGSWVKMDTARPLSPSRRYVSRWLVQTGLDLRSRRELGSTVALNHKGQL